jgi:hypothetical protein
VTKIEPRWVGEQQPAPPPEPEPEFKADPAWNKLLIVVGLVAVVAAVLVVPGILNRGGENPVAAAAEATSDAAGVRVTFTGSAQGPTQMSLSGKGVLNGETNRASIAMSATGATATGTQGFTLEEIVDDGDIYMRSPELGSVLGGAGRWMLMRSEVFGDLLQGGASGAGFSGSPTQQLDALEQASDQVTEVGPERINGVATTHYRATLDIQKMIDELKGQVSGDFEDLIEQSMEQVTSATVDVWIDGDGLLRRETSASSMGSLGTFTMTMDFSHYGIRPDIQVPPESEVFDVTPFMEKALEEFGS